MHPSPTKVGKDGTGRVVIMGNEHSDRRGSFDLAADESSESDAVSTSLERFVLEYVCGRVRVSPCVCVCCRCVTFSRSIELHARSHHA